MIERRTTDMLSEEGVTAGFETWPETGRIEQDRFCFACGYNLHQQSVRCEPRTAVLMCRCPECGVFHPVTAPGAAFSKWGQRLKGLLMLHWILFVLTLGFLVGLFHGVSMYFTLDEFTGYFNYQSRAYIIDIQPYYWEHPRMWAMVCGISGGCSFGLAFVGTTLMVIFTPHWRRSAHMVAVFVWAMLPAALVALIFWGDIPEKNDPAPGELLRWAVPYISAYTVCYLVGGAVALLVGRWLVRLMIRITVPPRWRVYLEAIRPQ